MTFLGKNIKELDTPRLLVNIDILKNNIYYVANRCKELKIKLRPHIKTHKIPGIAHMQLDAGAIGVSVAKLGEAEVMEANGIKDIMIANEVIGDEKIRRLVHLARRINISCLVDSNEGAVQLSKIAEKENVELSVYIDIDVGMKRCGIDYIPTAIQLAKQIKKLKKLKLRGILGFGSVFFKNLSKYTKKDIKRIGIEEGKLLIKFADSIKESGIEIKEIIGGSTPTWKSCGSVAGITEVQPGTYVFNDIMQVSVEACSLKDCAASVLSTVISTPSPNRAIVDAGSKTLAGNCSSDCFPSIVKGHGLIKGKEGIVLKEFSEEHGVLELRSNASEIKIGEKIEIIPNHICPVVNMFDEATIISKNSFVGIWPILARGKSI